MGLFPANLLHPEGGRIAFNSAGRSWAIEVRLRAFSSDDQYATEWRLGEAGPHVIRTALQLDSITLPVDSVTQLPGTEYHFPVNPGQGYIDGSVYLAAKHHPIDVVRLSFGALNDGKIEASIVGVIVFEHELWGVPNLPISLDATLRV
jgi:hypothetical protein